MGLVELVRGLQTSDATIEATQQLAAHLGKAICVSLVRSRVPATNGVRVWVWVYVCLREWVMRQS